MNLNQLPKSQEVIPLFYWGDIFWLKYLLNSSNNIKFSLSQTYRKQRNFNRTYILGGNGIELLTIPVTYQGMFPKLKEVKICYKEDWPKKHLKKLYFAYKNAAFFEYFWEFIEVVYHKRLEFLWEFNFECMKVLAKILQLNDFSLTDTLIPENKFSYRLEETPSIDFPPYFQLFTTQFIPNLSSLDLIFNLGTESKLYLKNISLNNN